MPRPCTFKRTVHSYDQLNDNSVRCHDGSLRKQRLSCSKPDIKALKAVPQTKLAILLATTGTSHSSRQNVGFKLSIDAAKMTTGRCCQMCNSSIPFLNSSDATIERELRKELKPCVEAGWLKPVKHEGWLSTRQTGEHLQTRARKMANFYQKMRKRTDS